MIRPPPISKRPYPLFPYTTLFRSLRLVLRALQPPPPPLRHRAPHPRRRSLRPRRPDPSRPPGRPRCRLHRTSRTIPPAAKRTPDTRDNMDQPSRGDATRHHSRLKGCITTPDTFRMSTTGHTLV